MCRESLATFISGTAGRLRDRVGRSYVLAGGARTDEASEACDRWGGSSAAVLLLP